MTSDEAARLAARFEEYANDPASVSIPSRQECLDASAILRAIPPIGTQAPIQVRELKRELRISSDHDYRPWFEIQEAFKRLTPPALVAQHQSAPVFEAPQNTAERDPSVMPDWAGADTALVAQIEALERLNRYPFDNPESNDAQIIKEIVRTALNATPATRGETEREYDSNIEPCNDAKFGMKP